MLRLIIKETSQDRRFATERNEVLIGRREGVDLRLEESACSPNHCLLRVEGDRVRLIDLGSASGTEVGGRKVEQALLELGEEFRIGQTLVRLASFKGPAPAPAPAPPLAAPVAAAAPGPRPGPRPAPVPHGSVEGDFSHEVRAMVAKVPWYFISLLFHVIALLVLDLVTYKAEKSETSAAIVAVKPEELAEPESPEDPVADLEDLDPELDPVPEDLETDEPLSQAVRKDPREALDLDYDDVVVPDRIGINRGRQPLTRLDTPLPLSKTKGADETINKGDLLGEQGRARDAVKRDLGDGIRRARRKLSRNQVIVVKGNFDEIEKILAQYEWPYTLIDKTKLYTKGVPGAKILFINCATRPGAPQKRKLVPAVKRFVRSGGWLVTSDWAVDPYLTDGFNAWVHKLRNPRRQPATTISVRPVSRDPLLKGVFPRRGQSIWWLEETSTMVAVTDRVNLLVTSEELRKRYGSNVVAFEFRYGRGRVIHMLGHFYQKDGNRRGLVAMHRLINNVILERVNPSN